MDIPPKTSSGQDVANENSHEQRVHFVRTFRRTLGVATMYGPDHAVARAQIEENYGELERVLRLDGRLDLAVADESVLVNGRPVGTHDPQILDLAKILNKLKLSDIGLRLGLTRQEYGELLEVFCHVGGRGAAQGLSGAELLRRKNLKHVRVQGGKYQRVADDQVIVDRRQGIAPSRHPGQASAQPSTARRHDFMEWERDWKRQMEQGWKLDDLPETSSARGATPASGPTSGKAIDPNNAVSPGSVAAPRPAATAPPSPAAGFISAPVPPSVRAKAPAPAPGKETAQPSQPPPITCPQDDATAGNTAFAKPSVEAKQVEAILAFLTGSDEGEGVKPGEVFARSRPDTRQLGALVLRAAVAALGSGRRGDEPFGDIVAVCLNRAILGLKQAPDGTTQEGHKNALQAVAALEEEVMGKLAMLSVAGEKRQAVAQSAKAMKNQLKTEGLAAGYAKHRRAIGSETDLGSVDSAPSKRRLLADVADIAGELRQPMQVVASSNDLLLKGRAGEINEEQRRLLELIHQSTARMGDLMGKLKSLGGGAATSAVEPALDAASKPDRES